MSKVESNLSRRQALFGILNAGITATTAGIIAGCGGTAPGVVGELGAATFEIIWPESSRLIPDASNSIKISFLQDGTVVSAQTVARPSSGTSTKVTFTTLPAGALTLMAEAYPTTSGTGVVQASASKVVTIVENVTTSMTITMESTIVDINVTPSGPAVVVGGTTQLAMEALNSAGQTVLVASSNVTWTSLATSIATVSSTGLVRGIAVGTAQITVTESESGVSSTFTVIVNAASTSCNLIPSETAGPYPLYTVLSNSAMIRSSINETKTGVPLTIELTLVKVNGSCGVVPDAYIYLWHCDRAGEYSGYSSSQNGSHAGETFCRGIQKTDSNGKVTFTTIYPGWYAGRITHVHFQVYLSTLSQSTITWTSQFGFPQAITYNVYDSTLYASKGQNTSVTSFAADNVFSDGTQYQIATVTGSVSAGYKATLVVGINT